MPPVGLLIKAPTAEHKGDAFTKVLPNVAAYERALAQMGVVLGFGGRV